jgi:hypothetical protein
MKKSKLKEIIKEEWVHLVERSSHTIKGETDTQEIITFGQDRNGMYTASLKDQQGNISATVARTKTEVDK